MLPLFSSKGCNLRGNGRSASARAKREELCRQVALCGAGVWALLVCVAEGFLRLAFTNRYEFLSTSERWGSAWTAFGLILCFVTNRRRFSGVHMVVGTALWTATVSEIVLASSKTLVLRDPVTHQRVQLMRWVEWTVLAFILTFASVILENSERVALLDAGLQSASVFCFFLMPFALEEISWSLLLVISMSSYASIFVRLHQSFRRRRRLLFLGSLAAARGLFFLAFFIEWGTGGSWAYVFQCALTLSLLILFTTKMANDETIDSDNRDLAKYSKMLGTLWVSDRDALGVSTIKNGKCRTLFSSALIEIILGGGKPSADEDSDEVSRRQASEQPARFMLDASSREESAVRIEFNVEGSSSRSSRMVDETRSDSPGVRLVDDDDEVAYVPGAIRRGARRLKLVDLIVGSWNVGRLRTTGWIEFGELEVLARLIRQDEEDMLVVVMRRSSHQHAFSLGQLSSSTEWREEVARKVIEALSGDVAAQDEEEIALIVKDDEENEEGRWSWDQVPSSKNVEHRKFAESLIDGSYAPRNEETDLNFLQQHTSKLTTTVDATLVATIHGCVRSKHSKTLVDVDDETLRVQVVTAAARPGHDEIYDFKRTAPPHFDSSQSWIIAQCTKLLRGSSSVQFGKDYTVFQTICPAISPEKKKRWSLRGSGAWGIAVEDSAVERHVVASIFEKAAIRRDRILLFDNLESLSHHVRSSGPEDRHVVVVSIEDGVKVVEDTVGPQFARNVITIVRTAGAGEERGEGVLDKEASAEDAVKYTLRALWEKRCFELPPSHGKDFEDEDNEPEENQARGEEDDDDDDDEICAPHHPLVRLLSTSSSSSFRSSSSSSSRKGTRQRPRSIKLVQPISKYQEELQTFKEHQMIVESPHFSEASGSPSQGGYAKIFFDP